MNRERLNRPDILDADTSKNARYYLYPVAYYQESGVNVLVEDAYVPISASKVVFAERRTSYMEPHRTLVDFETCSVCKAYGRKWRAVPNNKVETTR
jgi:hypothetical protein